MVEVDLEPSNVEKARALQEEETARAWANVAYTEDGRRVIWSILAMCDLYSSTFTGRADAAYLEGRRSIGLELLRDRLSAIDPAIYPQMMLADIDRQERLEIARQADEETDDGLD